MLLKLMTVVKYDATYFFLAFLNVVIYAIVLQIRI